MKVIITGGTGLIGTELAKGLVRDGHEVIVLSRNPAGKNLPTGVRAEKWDGKTAVSWGYLADGADALVNLAGENIAGSGIFPARWTKERKARIIKSRTDAGHAVVDAVGAVENKPKLVIQSSGIDFYGNVPEGEVTEESPAGNDSFLARVTIPWENSTAPVEQMGVRRVILRTGVVLAKDGGSLGTILLPFKFFAGGPVGSGKQWLSWIHMEDAVRAIRFLLENEDASGPYNLCAPEPVRYREFSKLIGRIIRRPSYLPAPAFGMKLLLGEAADLVLNGRCAVPKRLQEAGFNFTFPDAQSALQNLLKRRE
ncbi:MAG: TIGR01777 family protein [Chloroflexi bacterium]|nr:MAG: TIGR01777 family protein [Chloroflexota bacterium]